MRRALLTLLLSAAALSGAAPAVAQEPAEPTMVATVGVGGFVHPDRSAVMRVELTSPVLLVGNLVVDVGRSEQSFPVEVPAGGRKNYELALPPSSVGMATLSLVVDGGERILTQRLPLQIPSDELLVGLLGAPEVASVLGSVRSTPLGLPVTAVEVLPDQLADPGPLAYLVVGPGEISDLDEEVRRSLATWVESGGRVIGRDTDLEELGLEPGAEFDLGQAMLRRVGRGELVAVQSVAGLDAPSWPQVLRDVPPLGLGRDGMVDQGGASLLPAVLATDEALVPDISWLLVAIVGYALVVGPLNLLVLKRMGRRELAWITVPAISLLALGGFWLAGRTQVRSDVVRHASVVVAGEGQPQGGSVVLVASGNEGRRTVTLPDGWLGFPVSADAWFGQPGLMASPEGGGSTLEFDFARLGVGALESRWAADMPTPSVDVEVSGGRLTLAVQNRGPWDFWAWGAGGPGWAVPADDMLAAGADGTVTLDLPRFDMASGGNPLAETVLQSGIQSERVWERIYPLAATAALYSPDSFAGFYVFGFTDDFTPTVGIEDRESSATGPALVMVPVTLDEEELAVYGAALPDVIGVDEAGWVSRSEGFLFVEGGTLATRYRIPAGVTGPVAIDGEAPSELWDWVEGDWAELDDEEPLPAAMISPAGEVFARFDRVSGPFLPSQHLLRWEEA
jgi:hypothetical protein